MRTVTTIAGTPIPLDEEDVLAVLEAVSRELKRRNELEYGFEDVYSEIAHIVKQLTEDELRAFLKESLFMSFNRYENDQMAAILRKAARAKEQGHE